LARCAPGRKATRTPRNCFWHSAAASFHAERIPTQTPTDRIPGRGCQTRRHRLPTQPSEPGIRARNPSVCKGSKDKPATGDGLRLDVSTTLAANGDYQDLVFAAIRPLQMLMKSLAVTVAYLGARTQIAKPSPSCAKPTMLWCGPAKRSGGDTTARGC
jgi:hypothetical protein